MSGHTSISFERLLGPSGRGFLLDFTVTLYLEGARARMDGRTCYWLKIESGHSDNDMAIAMAIATSGTTTTTYEKGLYSKVL